MDHAVLLPIIRTALHLLRTRCRMHRSAPHCNFAEGILWHTSPPASERETFSVDFRRFSCSAKVKKTGHQILSPGFIKGTPPVRPGTPWSSCSLHKTRKAAGAFCHQSSAVKCLFLPLNFHTKIQIPGDQPTGQYWGLERSETKKEIYLYILYPHRMDGRG